MVASASAPEAGRTDEIVALLREPAAYPEQPEAVRVRETHMAWVFLTDRYAYKLKKPVRLSFLDYSTPGKRRAAVESELRLNARLAPWVYLGMVPVLDDGADLRLEAAEGVPAAWLVKMRRLPDAGFLDTAIEDGTLTPAWLAEAADLLGRFFAGQPAEPMPGEAYVSGLRRRVAEDAAAIRESAHTSTAQRAHDLATRLDSVIAGQRELLGTRASRRVDGHGDLRPEHVALGPPAAVIDCVEFNRDFRLNDPVEELAFLHLEATRLGAPWVGEHFRRAYAEAAGDHPPPVLTALYAAKRSLLRAKLAIWHIRPDGADSAYYHDRAETYLALGERFLAGLSCGSRTV